MDKILLTMDSTQAYMLTNGIKKYHYCTRACKIDSTAFIYVKHPINKVIGKCVIVDVIKNTPDNIWMVTSPQSGFTKNQFDSLYKNRTSAVALEIKDIKLYKYPKRSEDCKFNMIL